MKIFGKKKQKSEKQTQIIAEKHFIANQQIRYISEDRLPIFLRDKFYEYTGKLPTENLETLREKIIWSFMFDITPLKIQCADKVAVRDYVSKKIGNKYLPKLYRIYENPDEFDIDELPDSFVLSFNAGSGQNLIVKDKSKISVNDVKNELRQWFLYNHSECSCEMQYRYIPPRIIAREYMDVREDIEYKLWCFNGRVEFIELQTLMQGRHHLGRCHYSRNWERLDFVRIDNDSYQITEEIPRPKQLDKLIIMAEKLADKFSLVRVDFYETKSGDYMFGEMTFSPTAGGIIYGPNNDEIQKKFGKLFIMPERDENGFAIHKTKKIGK